MADVKRGFGSAVALSLLACVLYGLGAGLRGDIGVLLNPLAQHCAVSYQDVSFCIAVMNLVFGATQPFFGILASRRSNRFVLLIGVALIVLSLIGMMVSHGFVLLFITLGLVFGSGAGALAFGVVLASTMRLVGIERAMLVSGLLNAAAGMGGFVLSPSLQALLNAGGLDFTLSAMIAPTLILIPLVFVVTSADPKAKRGDTRLVSERGEAGSEAKRGSGSKVKSETDIVKDDASGGVSFALFKKAFSNKTFVLLVIGFTTCGFHMVAIESHLFSQFTAYGIEPTQASWAFSVYGIATIFGALLSGWLSTKVFKGRLLVFYYAFRAVWVVLFLFLMPKDLFGAVLFSIGLGMTGDATVSPTAGLVNSEFSLKEAPTLIGVLFLVHQIGAFGSAWCGGMLLSATGSYLSLWMLDVVLCLCAALVSSRIPLTRTKPGIRKRTV